MFHARTFMYYKYQKARTLPLPLRVSQIHKIRSTSISIHNQFWWWNFLFSVSFPFKSCCSFSLLPPLGSYTTANMYRYPKQREWYRVLQATSRQMSSTRNCFVRSFFSISRAVVVVVVVVCMPSCSMYGSISGRCKDLIIIALSVRLICLQALYIFCRHFACIFVHFFSVSLSLVAAVQYYYIRIDLEIFVLLYAKVGKLCPTRAEEKRRVYVISKVFSVCSISLEKVKTTKKSDDEEEEEKSNILP